MVSLSLIRFTVTRIETQGSLLIVGKPACVHASYATGADREKATWLFTMNEWVVSTSRDYELLMTFVYRGGEPVGLSPNIRVYRYSKGQFFDCHCRCIIMFLNMHFVPLRTLFDQVPIFNTTLTSDVSPVRRLLHQPVPDVSHGRATVGRAVSGFFSHLPRR